MKEGTIRLLTGIAMLLALSTAQGRGTRDARFEEANEAYRAGDYAAALTLYEDLAADGPFLAREVFFNLGNTHVRLGELGKAALAYRRAELLDPGMIQAQRNRRVLERRLGTLQFQSRGVDRALLWLRPGQWFQVSLAGGWTILIAGFALLRLRIRPPWQGLVLSLLVLGGFVAVSFGIAAAAAFQKDDLARTAIITSGEALAQTGPFSGAAGILELPTGSEVRIASEQGPWWLVEIPGGEAGWIRRDWAERLWPFGERPKN